ncbi:MAG: DNA repair protein RadA [Solirubrobacterales bacterium]|nr:DNA repair protein RadA [Solirubrobacterales bacterium]
MQWHGQCQGCGAWNTLEQVADTRQQGTGGRAGAGFGEPPTPRPLAEVGTAPLQRLRTEIGELDRVLGGGLVPGSLVLLGGSPGIGKSTLTTMALGNLAGAGRRVLYVSGEESPEQVRLRAERLGPAALGVPIVAETELELVLGALERAAVEVCVIDSVQTLRAGELPGAGGSVAHVREATARIMALAKERAIATVLVGHVTKDGALAGPRALEHLVDCVLQFEGERERPYRELRALKNRFGSTNEAGIFEMRQGGLVEVLDASARFVAEATRAPGSVVLAAMEGSRPLLVEVQALVAPSELEQPRRVVSGLDRNRLALVLAILARHGGVGTGGADVFVNVVGGVRVDEPGTDLALALAVASASRGAPLRHTPRACFGELGLTGELRWVGHPERRLAEAARHGLREVIAPPGSGATAREAAKQSRRAWFPEIGGPAILPDVAQLATDAACAVVLEADATTPLSARALPQHGEIILVVGPEGGISPAEREQLRAAGAVEARLGPTVLRTSTAGAAAAAVLLTRIGRW